MHRQARVLSACRQSDVLFIRNEILQHAGYTVAAAVSVDEALAAIDREPFDLIIVGHLYDIHEKNRIASKARRSGLKVLCMHSEAQHPDVQAADDFIHNLEGPERLLATVAALIEKQRRPGSASA